MRYRKAKSYSSKYGVVMVCPYCDSVLESTSDKGWECFTCGRLEQKYRNGYLYVKRGATP